MHCKNLCERDDDHSRAIPRRVSMSSGSVLICQQARRVRQSRRSRALHVGVWSLVPLQKPSLPPEEHHSDRHGDKYLEKNPDVDARENAIEGEYVSVGKPEPHCLVRSGGSQKEQRRVAGELVPAVLRKMKCLAKHEAEEVSS